MIPMVHQKKFRKSNAALRSCVRILTKQAFWTACSFTHFCRQLYPKLELSRWRFRALLEGPIVASLSFCELNKPITTGYECKHGSVNSRWSRSSSTVAPSLAVRRNDTELNHWASGAFQDLLTVSRRGWLFTFCDVKVLKSGSQDYQQTNGVLGLTGSSISG